METASNKAKNLIYSTRNNVIKMLEKRGYNVDNYSSFTKEEIILQFEQSSSKFLNSSETGPLDIIVENDDGKKIFVKYRLENKFKKSKSLDIQIDEIFSNKINKDDTLIVILISRILSIHRDNNAYICSDEYFKKKSFFVQFFGLENFIFVPTDNNIVPEHTIINDEESRQVLKNFNIDIADKLPHILREDPIAKYIGLRPGQICKIKATSFSSMYTTKYRFCVS